MCSINTTPFITAMPNNAIKPTPAEIQNWISRAHSNRIPPVPKFRKNGTAREESCGAADPRSYPQD